MILKFSLLAVLGIVTSEITNDLEFYLLEAIKNNVTLTVGDDNLTESACDPFTPVKPDFNRLGQRIIESKCHEYAWETKRVEDEAEWANKCRMYVISQIQRGTIPEVFAIINWSVIFGGRPAKPAEFPHMAAIGWKAKNINKSKWIFKCGGSLISEQFVLSAAHCTMLPVRRHLDIINPMPEMVRLGVENIADDMFNIYGDPVDVKIKRITVHPKYRSPKKYNDIALFELENKVQFAHNVLPACLWTKPSTRGLGKKGTLTGWGKTEEGKTSTTLNVAVVDILRVKQCGKFLAMSHNRNWRGFAKHQFCAGKLAGKVDTCQGDSGGPLQVRVRTDQNVSMNMIVGVTSFGISCAREKKPGVYTKVSSFSDWIESIVWGGLKSE
ncbi:serine protease snake-like [Leptidea sinapis]|uniref:Peptidase S1 domain-containing protein n=1 Tax=Leptidea sinapis TaxID=189913 RepID=A0A5E4QEB9_9NEOP|nr:serine protease snake-like [Leptidea sinapis]VVC95337.1 unnamed protein product [Leptidea sinapis]